MKKLTKIILGVISILPILYMIFFLVFIFYQVFHLPKNTLSPNNPPGWLPALFILHLLMMLLIIGLLIFYIINIFRNDRVAKDNKALWAVVLFMGNMFAMPIYWYLYIWREPKK